MRPARAPAAALAALALLAMGLGGDPAWAEEPPSLRAAVAEGKLPPLADRLPAVPLMDPPIGDDAATNRGGAINTLVSRARDTRLMTVWGYARLVRYDASFAIVPDIAERVEVEDGRVFTFHLRPGHRWSDGHPFTADDFRYFMEDVAANRQLSPAGMPAALLAGGKPPRFEILGPHAVRFAWEAPHPTFLAEIAAAAPFIPYRPAHYMRQFHIKYNSAEDLAAKAKAAGARNWAQLHNRLDNLYRADNPDLPTLDPWVVTTRAPAERFVFRRNPYFHRLDALGRQLPHLDEVVLEVVDARIVPIKAAAGESMLQARYLGFDNYTLLKRGAREGGHYDVRLWTPAKGAHIALYPNLTAADPAWRAALRDPRVRRALSLAIDRQEINAVVYFGLGRISQNTAQRESPLFREEAARAWTTHDPALAGRLLDEAGYRRDGAYRRLPDGRRMAIVVETAGESAEESDVLQLVADHWRQIGVLLITKPTQVEALRKRVSAGETLMTIAAGVDNGVPTADQSPAEWTPTSYVQWQWSRWGNWIETSGKAGEAPDLPWGQRLAELQTAWGQASDASRQTAIWREVLDIHADLLPTIGLISGVPQPVVAHRRLRGLPATALFNWNPGAQFGVHRMDRFWLTAE